MAVQTVLGIDIGGSGIKGALVDVTTGDLAGPREVIPTPSQPTSLNMARALATLTQKVASGFTGSVGIAFPGVVKGDAVMTAANLAPDLVGVTARELLSEVPLDPTAPAPVLVNDADAAGMAEVRFGAAKSYHGLVLVVTLGTGIGTALIHHGVLVPNSELGHLKVARPGPAQTEEPEWIEAEHLAAGRVRREESLNWDVWGSRLNTVLAEYEALLAPVVFILGGAVSQNLDLYEAELSIHTPVVAAAMGNDAGIVGAALMASEAPS